MIRSAKIMLLGDIGVGKSSLAKRLVFNKFDTDYKTTIGVNVLTHDLAMPAEFGGETMRLVLWDTDGDFGQTLFRTSYVLGSAGAVVVADATRPASIEHMETLAQVFEDRYPGRPVSCVINKADLVEHVPATRGDGRAVVATSALTGDGVEAMFLSLALAVQRRGL